MPLLRKPVLKPIVGVDYMNPSTMLNDRGGFPKNMRLFRDELKKREGKSLYGSSPISDAPVMHLCQYRLDSGAIRLIRISKKKVEKYNTVAGTWSDITGTNFTGDEDNFFSTCIAQNMLIISNYIDKIRIYNDTGNTYELAATDGAVPKAKHIEYNESGYLLVANVIQGGTAYPTKVVWPDIGDITKWGSGNAASALLRHSPEPIMGLKNLNAYTIAYKTDSIYTGRPVETSEIIKWDLAYTGVGLGSSRGIVSTQGKHFFIGTDDFYSFNGVDPVSIASKTIQREAFSRVDSSNLSRSFAILASDYDEIWFFVVTSGKDWPTEVWKYNYRNGYWYYDTCDEITSAVLYYSQSSLTWQDLTGDWDSQNFRWGDSLATTNKGIIVLGDSDGYTQKLDFRVNNDNGEAIDGIWETPDFVADKMEYYKRWLQLDVEAKGDSVTIDYSTDYGSTWTSIKTLTLTNSFPTKPERVYFDVLARNIRFRFRNNNAGETFYLRQYYPYYLYREEANR